ncbi:uncharacterized protein DDB_G0283697 [Drosophila tropicalis]|uniref:uncharacterized protein DDB_G0283697 n=1 Tax=Drosophila tropicalis TaxID=46794 RepID=UPI0035AC061E
MARIEITKKPKRQGKKRKHENDTDNQKGNAVTEANDDDEVATKVQVISDPHEEEHIKQKKKSKGKRKQENSEEAVDENSSKQKELEQEEHENTKKGKKRKHNMQEGSDNDEVDTKKQAILQTNKGEDEEPTKKNKANKRKQDIIEKDLIKKKRSKQQAEEDDQDEVDEDQNDDEHEQPTAAQLQEAAKPENSNAIVTVRQKKKLKHLQRLEAQKEQHADKDVKRNEEYLNTWKNSRQDWKFNKLRQISIQKLAFDVEKLSLDIWPNALEYLASSKGAAKATIIKLAEDVIQTVDKDCEQFAEESEKQQLINSPRYQRARDLLQSFD